MKNRLTRPQDEERLVRLLQREAAAETPDFSPALHDRIMQAVTNQRSTSAPDRVAQRDDGTGDHGRWLQPVQWAAALAMLLLLFFVVKGPSAFDDETISQEAAASSAGSVVESLDELSATASLASDQIVKLVADQTVIDRHWDFWDSGTQALADTLLDPLPISWQSSVALQEDRGS
jgi:hypothetical protein